MIQREPERGYYMSEDNRATRQESRALPADVGAAIPELTDALTALRSLAAETGNPAHTAAVETATEAAKVVIDGLLDSYADAAEGVSA
ncbi:hypothetical protein PBI_MEGABEAR_43 [Mycobacterium phage Megabear]|nr:hypothetical protein PBI_MEGABEAR_43 [Mycobacterium phage Megabear]